MSLYYGELDPRPLLCIDAFRRSSSGGYSEMACSQMTSTLSALPGPSWRCRTRQHVCLIWRYSVLLAIGTTWLIVLGVFSVNIILHFLLVTDEDTECLSAFFSKNSYLSGSYDDDGSFTQLDSSVVSAQGSWCQQTLLPGPAPHRLPACQLKHQRPLHEPQVSVCYRKRWFSCYWITLF